MYVWVDVPFSFNSLLSQQTNIVIINMAKYSMSQKDYMELYRIPMREVCNNVCMGRCLI
jgi:hypothetical protein